MVLVQPAGMVLYYSLIPTPSPAPVFVSTNMNLEDLRDFINVMSMDSSARGIILRSLLAMSGPKIWRLECLQDSVIAALLSEISRLVNAQFVGYSSWALLPMHINLLSIWHHWALFIFALQVTKNWSQGIAWNNASNTQHAWHWLLMFHIGVGTGGAGQAMPDHFLSCYYKAKSRLRRFMTCHTHY